MRKNKKLLLASVAAMGALALGVGATSTFAWFQVTQSVEITTTDVPDAALGVAETSNQLDLDAEIHMVVGDPMYYDGTAKDLESGKPVLTTWGTSSGTISATPTENDTLITGYMLDEQAVAPTFRSLTGSEIGWIYFPVSAWVEDTYTGAADPLHDTAWENAVEHSGKKAVYTYSYTNTDGHDTGDVNKDGNDEGETWTNIRKLLTAEVKFYTQSPASAPTSFDKTKDAATGNDLKLSVNAEDLVGATDYTDVDHQLLIGYIVVRVDGGAGNYNHILNVNYTAQIASSGQIVDA